MENRKVMFNQIQLNPKELEQSVIGCVFFGDEPAISVVSELREIDFIYAETKLVFRAVCHLVNNGFKVDFVTIMDVINKWGKWSEVISRELYDMAGSVSTSVNLDYYLSTLKEMSYRRQIINYAQNVKETALKAENFDDVTKAMGDVIDFTFKSTDKPTGQILQETVDRIAAMVKDTSKRIPGHETGFIELDKVTGGLKDGELITLTAEPNIGKSLLANQICINFAKRNKYAFYFNFEMNEQQIGDRTLAIALAFDINKIKFPKENLSEEDINLLAENKIQDTLSEYLRIFTDCGRTIADIKSKCLKYSLQGKGPEIIVIDYLQMMDAPGNTTEAVLRNLSKGLKALAMEYKCPVIVIVSLNREGKTYGSGQTDYDADQQWKLDREHDAPNKLVRAETKLKVVKNRDGGKGIIDLIFIEKFLRFETIEKKG